MKKSRSAISALFFAFLAFSWAAAAVPEPATCVDQGNGEKAPLLSSLIGPPDAAIVEIFAGTGANDISTHGLTAQERTVVDVAFNSLPRLHRDVLRRHLRRISFLDLQPGAGSALTSRANLDDTNMQFDITFKASLLNESLTQFLNTKEARLFSHDGSDLSVQFGAGNSDALTYILLHEATHVVDQVLGLSDDDEGPFRVGIWDDLSTPAEPHASSLAMKTPFRREPKVPLGNAPAFYESLRASPFVSFYATAAAAEDLAELVAWQQMASRFEQPPTLTVRDGEGETVYQYEPLKSPELQTRFAAIQEYLERYERGCLSSQVDHDDH